MSNSAAPAPASASAAAPDVSRHRRSGPPEAGRLMSLDALRGFDMFWIAGGGLVVSALDAWSDNAVFGFLKGQLSHVDWAGFAFYDLIFPLFVFLVGASIVLSLRKSVAKHGRRATARKILKRGVLLFALGIFYSGGLSTEWPDIRLLGVLQRLALCYTATGLLFVFFRLRWLILLWLVLLLGYWSALAWVPIRDIELAPKPLAKLAAKKGETNVVTLFNDATGRVRGHYEPGYNLPNHLDFQYLPGRKYNTYWDPEGLLSTLPAIATCLLGVFAGLWQQAEKYSPTVRSVGLIVTGFLAMSVGYLWGFQFPVVKKLWTSSFVFVAGGYSLMLLGAFHQIIDVWGWRGWCQPFVWVGSNPLTIYLAAQILGFRKLAEHFAGGPIKAALGQAGDTVVALVAVALLFWFARFLYRRHLFLRV